MKASTKAKLIVARKTILIWIYVGALVALCLVGACAALLGLESLDQWCQKQMEN